MAFVQSGGQLAMASATPAERFPVPAGAGVALAGGTFSTYAAIWKAQPQVRMVCGFLARNIAQLGLHLFRRVSATDRERVTDHPLADLLDLPSPTSTQYRMLDSLVQDLAVYDVAALLKVQAGQRRALLRLAPSRLFPNASTEWTVDHYRYFGPTGRHIDLDPEQVVLFHGHDPNTNLWGTSPMETLHSLLAEEDEAVAARRQLWRNGARIQGYIERPAEANEWSPEARDRFRQSWRAQYTGDGPNAGGTPILEDGMSFKPVAIDPKAAQYIEARKLTREEVASAYHIPLPMVGILEHATFSNIKEQHKQLYADCLGPWLAMITQELRLQLFPDFVGTADMYAEFNIEAKLAGSFEEQAAQLQTAVGGPWLTRNEARARRNLPAIEGGDELITPLNVVIGGQASPTDSAPPAAIEQ